MKESVQDFIARGGTINRVPEVQRQEPNYVINIKSSSIEIMDLDNGAHIYSEAAMESKKKRGVKPNTGKTRAVKITASLLPQSLLGLLQNIGVKIDEEKRAATPE